MRDANCWECLFIFEHNYDKCTKHQFIHLLTATCSDWHIKNSKNHKKVILWFLLFLMCQSLHVAVNKCINWCFVHLYLLFYYNNKVFLCWWPIINHLLSMAMKTLNPKYFGVTILIFRGHVTSLVTWPLDSAYVVSYWWSIGTMRLSCTFRRYKASKLHLPMLKAKSSLRMRRVTWPVGRGSKITTYLEFPCPHCLFTIQLLWGNDDD